MRVSDEVQRCVFFIGVPEPQRDGKVELRFRATAFLVAIPCKHFPGKQHTYLVTAKHVADKLDGRKCYIRLNNHGDGPATITEVERVLWFGHPTDKNVDVVVSPATISSEHWDVLHIPVEMLLTREKQIAADIGPGDEVFISGLFANHYGKNRNIPIIRMGNIAMMPRDPVLTRMGNVDAYLIEARSLGGISGSPVFVRETSQIKLQAPLTGPPILGIGRYFLLGLMHGHWDLPVDDNGQSVNMGIAIVVPAAKILEVLFQPALVKMRELVEEQELENLKTPDTGKKVATVKPHDVEKPRPCLQSD